MVPRVGHAAGSCTGSQPAMSCCISHSASTMGSGNVQRWNKPPACSGHMRPRTLSRGRLPLSWSGLGHLTTGTQRGRKEAVVRA